LPFGFYLLKTFSKTKKYQTNHSIFHPELYDFDPEPAQQIKRPKAKNLMWPLKIFFLTKYLYKINFVENKI